MNDLLSKPNAGESMAAREEVFSAVIAYEDAVTRDRAMQVCERLFQRFWKDMEFDFKWWRFDFLRDAGFTRQAGRQAAGSDLILFSAHARRELPGVVEKWIESWLPMRGTRDGVLVAMIGTAEDQLRGSSPIQVYLREVAQRANMDYLSQAVGASVSELNASIETITKRAEKVTSLLDGILHHATIPPRWGINE
jgi:hypothetical protein